MRALRPRREQLIEAFGLGPHADKEAHALSAGLRQRLATACALIQQAPLLLLDEPTLGLDVESAAVLEELLRELVAREGVTILVTSHELEMIERVAKRVIIIQSGEIVVDAPVRELLGLFRSRRYRCVLTLPSGRVPAPAAAHAGTLLPALGAALVAPPRRDGDRWTLEFELDDAGRLFDYLDLIRQGGFLIESITRDQPDLRQAYLRFIRGDRGAHEALGGARRVAAESSGTAPGSSTKAEEAEAGGRGFCVNGWQCAGIRSA